MPAGVTWGKYITVFATYLLSMFAGAQTVHYIYKPLDDFNAEIERRKKEIRAERAQAAVEESSQL